MLKASFTSCFAIFFLFAFAQRSFDVLHYRFDIGLNDQNDSLKGKAMITLRFNEPASLVTLDLVPVNEAGKGMLAYAFFDDSVSISGRQKGDKLELALQHPAKKDDTCHLLIQYRGIPADGLIISKTKYGRRSFFADNWPNRGHNWLPCVDDPSDKATVEFIVTAPQHYQVVANGIQVEETWLAGNEKKTHWNEDVPTATKVMVIGVADFAVGLAGSINDCIPVYSWVYPEERDKGFYDYAQAMDILPFYIKNVGPYGYKKLANVQSKTTFGGLENANTIFYHENSITGGRKSEGLMAHEIAHQWFGNMATEKSFAHLWLSEGFATFMTIAYLESKYGRDTAMAMRNEDREQVIAFAKKSDRPVVDETRDYMKLLNANSYQKGGWVLHMLQNQLGNSVFWKSIRNYYAAYAGKNADTKDLQSVFEKTSGKDLSSFFHQWLYTPGLPKLEVDWKYKATENKLVVHFKQMQKTAFIFPMDIEIKTSKGSVVKTVSLTMAEQDFSIPVNGPVTGIILDPHTNLLFDATVNEAKTQR